MIQRQYVGLLDLLQSDVALDMRYAWQAQHAFHHQFRKRLQVRSNNAQEVVGVAGHGKTLHHFGNRRHGSLEGIRLRFPVAFENHVGESGHTKADSHRIEQRSIAGDQAGFAETLQTTTDLRRREIDRSTKRGIGRVAVALQCIKKGKVIAVKRYSLHIKSNSRTLIAQLSAN